MEGQVDVLILGRFIVVLDLLKLLFFGTTSACLPQCFNTA